MQIKSLEKSLAKDEDLREKYNSQGRFKKGYVIAFEDAHEVENRSDKMTGQSWEPVRQNT